MGNASGIRRKEYQPRGTKRRVVEQLDQGCSVMRAGFLAPLVKTRGFRMTPSEEKSDVPQTARLPRKQKSGYRVALTVYASTVFEPGRSHQIRPPPMTSPMAMSCVPVMAPPKTDPRPGSSRRYSRKKRATP